MISKQQAREIAKAYIEEKGRTYTDIDPVEKIGLWKNEKILYGERKGEFDDNFGVGYGTMWGLEEKTMFVVISANTGKVL